MEEELRTEHTASDFMKTMDAAFNLPERDWSQYSPLALAWLGDTVCDMAVRTALIKKGNRQAEKLHREASALVNARAQAGQMERILSLLSEEEEAIFRRGRNASPPHTAKNADRADYLTATGFECLLGYLYLEGRYQRIAELMRGLLQE